MIWVLRIIAIHSLGLWKTAVGSKVCLGTPGPLSSLCLPASGISLLCLRLHHCSFCLWSHAYFLLCGLTDAVFSHKDTGDGRDTTPVILDHFLLSTSLIESHLQRLFDQVRSITESPTLMLTHL